MERKVISLFGHRVALPGSKPGRILLGSALILGGLVGFLPVVGFWMAPVGLLVLAVDLPWALRLKRRLVVWWGRRRKR